VNKPRQRRTPAQRLLPPHVGRAATREFDRALSMIGVGYDRATASSVTQPLEHLQPLPLAHALA
jgi:hypothetical protein